MQNTLSLIIPVFNEEKSIKNTIKKAKAVLNSLNIPSELIIINDGSKDNTKKILEYAKDVIIINHPKNLGYGASLKTGILNARGNLIAITDADSTYPIEDLPKLCSHMDNYDMVIGSRTKKGSQIPLIRRPAKFLLNKLAEYITRHKIPDLNSGLRVFKKELGMKYWSLFPDGFSFTSTITIASLTDNHKVLFIPINYLKRKGKSTINPIKDTINFFNLVIRVTTYFKPLNVLTPLSLILFSLGIIKGLFDFIGQNSIGAGSIMIMLTSVQIFVLGLISDLIIKRTTFQQ